MFTLSAMKRETLPETLQKMSDVAQTRLVRNLFNQLGWCCQTRRRGDTNVRMDGILVTPDNRIGVVEIEFSDSLLESPRALLEDVAVLHNRHSIEQEWIIPISVVARLPNARAEYYEVTDDVAAVVGHTIRTFTVGSLLLFVWHFRDLGVSSNITFTTSSNGANLYPAIQHCAPEIPDLEPYPGSLRTIK
jgi:hypothetical protein